MRVLITGATGGIGYEFALIYAQKKYNLVLVARNTQKLQEIKKDFENKHNIEVKIIDLDLSLESSVEKIISIVDNQKIDILINNAGIGEVGEFINSDISKITSMINLNINTLTRLTHYFANKMVSNGSGKILNISSTASFQPIALFAVYSATKSYVLHFSEAINYELKDKNVKVCTLCPGPTITNFDKNANASHIQMLTKGAMSAKDVAQAGVKQLENNQMTVVVGFKNKVLAFISNINPFRELSVSISSNIMKWWMINKVSFTPIQNKLYFKRYLRVLKYII